MNNRYYIAIFLALILDIILYSVFPVFNTVYPQVAGLPFFYVYQIIMLVITSIIFLIVSMIKG